MKETWFSSCLLALLTGVSLLNALAQEEPRTHEPRLFELSTRGLPVSGTLSFLDGDGTALKTVAVDGERYFWSVVPAGAVAFELSTGSEGEAVEKVALMDAGSTFVNVNPTRPVVAANASPADKSATSAQMSLTRLPLVEAPRSMAIVAAGEVGWVYVGKLAQDSDASEWLSLYLLDAGSLKKPDAEEPFPFSALKAAVGRQFVADFPLVLRPSATDEGRTGLPILRGGQRFEILEVTRLGEVVRAKIKVAEVSGT